MALIGRNFDAGAGDHVLQGATRQLAVVGEALGIEQHMAFGGIGRSAFDQLAEHDQHLTDMGGGARLERRAQHAERIHVLMIDGGELVGDGRDVHALVDGGLVYLVVHVGDVAGIDHVGLAIEPPQHAKQHVEHHSGPGIADMGEVVDRGSADIERDPLGVARNEGALHAG